MARKEALQWLKGRKVALCDPDALRVKKLVHQLESWGLEVVVFPDVDAVLAEIERQHYTTYRMYLVILVDLDFALAAEQTWIQVTNDNPSILETPVTLMYDSDHETSVQDAQELMKSGYIRFMLEYAQDDGKGLSYLMQLLDRWKRRQHSLSETAQPAVQFD